jgi:HSP20 family protein
MNEHTIYPGIYIPLPEVNALLEELRLKGESSVSQPHVNIDEFENYFKIEVVIYGVNREEILITVDENVLTVTALNKDKEEKVKHELHEFNHCCFTRHILLPDNTDPQFIIAEYKAGILRIYVPKSSAPIKNVHASIVVY